jgi:hypothetical protein
MRKLPILLLGLLGGCGAQFFNPYYDRPNPWDTRSDRSSYLDKKEQDWQLELGTNYEYPRNEGTTFTVADLEGWRDTVLVNADPATLLRMRDQSVQKIAGLEARAQSMAPINEHTKEPIYELLWQARVEKVRLKMIEERLGSVSR